MRKEKYRCPNCHKYFWIDEEDAKEIIREMQCPFRCSEKYNEIIHVYKE